MYYLHENIKIHDEQEDRIEKKDEKKKQSSDAWKKWTCQSVNAKKAIIWKCEATTKRSKSKYNSVSLTIHQMDMRH